MARHLDVHARGAGRFVRESGRWERFGGLRTAVPDPMWSIDFLKAAAEVRAHAEEHGQIRWSELRWSELPHVVLRHAEDGVERTWTSVHLALRKIEGDVR